MNHGVTMIVKNVGGYASTVFVEVRGEGEHAIALQYGHFDKLSASNPPGETVS
ncbi:MAG: hypothetical protein ABSB74_16025 [Tepidisphaeraceae bacterium]